MPKLLPLNGGDYYLWKYVPSTPASVIAAILWLTISSVLVWRMFKTRTWFCSAFIIGSFMEVIGYCARAAAGSRTDSLLPYILQYNMILLPPALFAATIYMILGRIILLTEAAHLSIVSPRWLTAIFVSGDVISFMMLGSSSGLTILSTDHPSLATTAKWVVIVGLGIQLVAFALFGLTALAFHARITSRPTAASLQVDQKWQKTLQMLYGVSALVIVRSVFRLIEYAGGEDGYLLSHEWPLYVFDTLTMLAVAVVFFYVYPSNIVKNKGKHIPLSEMGSRENILRP